MFKAKDDFSKRFLQLSEAAYSCGQRFQLDARYSYGPSPVEENRRLGVCHYYHYLAGLIRLSGFTRVFEVGTYYGGAIRAMRRGVSPLRFVSPVFATVDVDFHNPRAFESKLHRNIRRFHGDALDKQLQQEVSSYFGNEPIELLYLDAVHTYEHTLECFTAYTNLLQPKLVVLDDIARNPGMKQLWQEMQARYPTSSYDVTAHAGRLASSGFGAIVV